MFYLSGDHMKATFDHTCMPTVRNHRDTRKHTLTPPQHLSGVAHGQRHHPLRGVYSVKSAFKTQAHRGTRMFLAAENDFSSFCNQAVTACECPPCLNSTVGLGPHGKYALTRVNIAGSLTGKTCHVLISQVCVC